MAGRCGGVNAAALEQTGIGQETYALPRLDARDVLTELDEAVGVEPGQSVGFLSYADLL